MTSLPNRSHFHIVNPILHRIDKAISGRRRGLAKKHSKRSATDGPGSPGAEISHSWASEDSEQEYFNWESDMGLEPNIDGSAFAFLDPHQHMKDQDNDDFSKTFIPLPGFPKFTHNRNGSFILKFLLFLLLSFLVMAPPLLLKELVVFYKNPVLESLVLFFELNFPFFILIQVALVTFFLESFFITYLLGLGHYIACQFNDSQKFGGPSPKGVSDSFLVSAKSFQILSMAKTAIFYVVYFGTLIIIHRLFSLYGMIHGTWHSFSDTIRTSLNILFSISLVLAIQKIFVAKIVSDFYETAYSDRLMDFCFAIQAVKKLVDHIRSSDGAHIECMDSLKHKMQSGGEADIIDPEDRECDFEEIPSSYNQFQTILLNFLDFKGLFDTQDNAKRTARLIYEHFVSPSYCRFSNRKYRVLLNAELFIDDMAGVLNETDIRRIFTLFDFSGNSSVSPMEMKVSLVRLFLEKKALSKSLGDHGRAVEKLDQVASILSLLLLLFLVPFLAGVLVLEIFVSLAQLLFSLSFMFGTSSSVLFNSIIFMFITHPFDVGDRVFISSETYFVHEIGIFCTLFQKWDGQLVYYPNSALIDKLVVNIKRSRNMIEWIEIVVDGSTSREKLALLNERVSTFIAKEYRDFDSGLEGSQYNTDSFCDASIQFSGWDFVGSRALRLGLPLRHKFNFQDGFNRAERHLKFIRALQGILIELDIVYYPPRLRLTYDPAEFEKIDFY